MATFLSTGENLDAMDSRSICVHLDDARAKLEARGRRLDEIESQISEVHQRRINVGKPELSRNELLAAHHTLRQRLEDAAMSFDKAKRRVELFEAAYERAQQRDAEATDEENRPLKFGVQGLRKIDAMTGRGIVDKMPVMPSDEGVIAINCTEIPDYHGMSVVDYMTQVAAKVDRRQVGARPKPPKDVKRYTFNGRDK